MCLFPYHTKWGELLSNGLWILNMYNSADVSAAHQHFCSCWLLSIRTSITMVLMLLLCISFFLLIHDDSPPVFPTKIMKSSTKWLLTSIYFTNAPSSSTLTCFNGCCLFLYVVRIKRMIRTGDRLDAVGKTHIILIFLLNTVRMYVENQI